MGLADWWTLPARKNRHCDSFSNLPGGEGGGKSPPAPAAPAAPGSLAPPSPLRGAVDLRRFLSCRTGILFLRLAPGLSVAQGPLAPLPLWTPSAPKVRRGTFGIPRPRGALLPGRPLAVASIGLHRPMVRLAALHERAPPGNPHRRSLVPIFRCRRSALRACASPVGVRGLLEGRLGRLEKGLGF